MKPIRCETGRGGVGGGAGGGGGGLNGSYKFHYILLFTLQGGGGGRGWGGGITINLHTFNCRLRKSLITTNSEFYWLRQLRITS
jgi:hypothetical protein